MSNAADLIVDSVRVAMHNVTNTTFDQFYDLGSSEIDSPNNTYCVGLTLHAKPDAWDRPRAMRTTLYFDNEHNLQDFLSSLKNQIDELRSKLYASLDARHDALPDTPPIDNVDTETN
tara:strand:+ start:1428 stop:1778 length:351 start_codon:yes stop_codon:yes gene_type:complete